MQSCVPSKTRKGRLQTLPVVTVLYLGFERSLLKLDSAKSHASTLSTSKSLSISELILSHNRGWLYDVPVCGGPSDFRRGLDKWGRRKEAIKWGTWFWAPPPCCDVLEYTTSLRSGDRGLVQTPNQVPGADLTMLCKHITFRVCYKRPAIHFSLRPNRDIQETTEWLLKSSWYTRGRFGHYTSAYKTVQSRSCHVERWWFRPRSVTIPSWGLVVLRN